MKTSVKNIIDRISPISGESLEKLEKHLVYESIPKDEVFIKRGRRNEKEYFLIDGICKSYLVSPEGEEITISFFTTGDVLSPNNIRTAKGLSNLNFKALKDATLATVNATVFKSLMIENLDVRFFGNSVVQLELQAKIEKEIGMAAFSAKERLLAFRKQFKSLENCIPHTAIATYLGITNVTLSRLKRELMI